MRATARYGALAFAATLALSACARADEQGAAPIAGSARATTSSPPGAAEPDGALPSPGMDVPLLPTPGDLQLAQDQIAELRARTCSIQLRSLQTATEAYFAEHGAYPDSEAMLIADGLLAEDISGQDLRPDGAITAVNECVGIGEPTGISVPERPAESQCKVDLKLIEVAREAFIAGTGTAPVSEDQLVGDYMGAPSADFDLAADGSIVVAPGSLCVM